MTVKELVAKLDAKLLTKAGEDNEVKCGYVCDLLSWVMARGKADTAWVTVQTHLNVVAVATLLDMAAIIIPDSIDVPQETVDKADEEGIAMLSCALSSYDICSKMSEAGIEGA